MRFVSLSLMLSSVAYGVDISTCGQIVDAGQVGEVVGDLDCKAVSGSPAVTLKPASTLHLNGHAVAGGHLGVFTDPGKKGGPQLFESTCTHSRDLCNGGTFDICTLD